MQRETLGNLATNVDFEKRLIHAQNTSFKVSRDVSTEEGTRGRPSKLKCQPAEPKTARGPQDPGLSARKGRAAGKKG